jgi:hypothetical protein
MDKLDIRCEGCVVSFTCIIMKYCNDIIKECPCSICLIKSMCKSLCKERVELYRSIPAERRRELHKRRKEEYYSGQLPTILREW